MNERSAESGGMQSLAERARGPHCAQPRWTLVLVGVIMIAVHGVIYGIGNAAGPPQNRLPALHPIQLTNFGMAIAGIVLVLLGIAAKSHPVLCMSLGLAIFVAGTAISSIAHPTCEAIVIQIIIAVIMIQTLQATQRMKTINEPPRELDGGFHLSNNSLHIAATMRSSEPDRHAIKSGDPPPGPSSRAVRDEVSVSIFAERLTNFFDRELHEKRGLPIVESLFILIGVGSLAASIVFGHLAWLLWTSAGVWIFGLVLWLARPPALTVRFTEDGVAFSPSGFFLPYNHIHQIFAPDRLAGRSFPILLLCEGGHIVLSKKLDADSEDIYQFLATQPLGIPRVPEDMDPQFEPFLRQQAFLHGTCDILVYRPPTWTQLQRTHTSWRHDAETRTAVAFLLAAIAWLGVFAVFGLNSAAHLVVIVISFAVLVLAVFVVGLSYRFKSQSFLPRKLRTATLVMSPSGLAISQGDLQGEIRWSEITSVNLQRNTLVPTGPGTAAGVAWGAHTGVLLYVQGATVLIADIYHWPARHIEWLILMYSGI